MTSLDTAWGMYLSLEPWIEGESEENDKASIHLYNVGKSMKTKVGVGDVMKKDSGYKLPVRLVR